MAESLDSRGRQRVSKQDVLLALLVLAFCLLPILLGPPSDMLVTDPAAPMIWASVVGSAALTLRKRRPWSVWSFTTLTGLVAVGAGGGPTPAYLPAIVALYSVSVRSETVRAVQVALLSALAPVIVILTASSHDTFDAVAFGMAAWSGVALMSGIATRSQRAAVESAQERARLAEATREEEAQRRVTEDRLRIARDLHDVMAHHVSVINVQAGVASYLIGSDPVKASAAMAHVREASQAVLGEVSTMLGLLRSTNEELETAPAPRLSEIDALVERVRHSGVKVVMETTGLPVSLSAAVDLTAYRIAQEALTNATRHGTGTAVVRLKYARDTVTIEVMNMLSRLSPATVGGGHGLTGMRERVKAVGGSLHAGPDQGSQWLVRATLPTLPADARKPEHPRETGSGGMTGPPQ